MPFLIETFDKPDCQALRLEVRQAHLEYLDANVVTLLACGAKLSDDGETASGGIYLVDLDSREEAEHFIESDPFHQAGLFAEVKIVRWRQAYLNRKNTLQREYLQHNYPWRSAMLFHVKMVVKLPSDMPAEQVADIKAKEKAYSQELQRQGKWRHLWRIAGSYANVSIFDVSDNAELHDLISGLPLFPYMDIHVKPLCRHPSSVHQGDA